MKIPDVLFVFATFHRTAVFILKILLTAKKKSHLNAVSLREERREGGGIKGTRGQLT